MMKVPPPGISLSLTRSLLLFFFLFSSRLLTGFVSNWRKWRKNGEKSTQKDTKDTESSGVTLGTGGDCVSILVTALVSLDDS